MVTRANIPEAIAANGANMHDTITNVMTFIFVISLAENSVVQYCPDEVFLVL
jgi:hypothetical protein